MFFLNNFIFLLPEIYLSFLILFLLVIGVFFNKIQIQKKYFGGLQNVLILSFIGLFYLFFLIYFHYNCDFIILNFHYIGARFNHFIKVFIILVVICVFILSKNFSKYEKEFHFEYYILIFLALLGLLLVVNANDFIFLYLALELQSLSLYVLAASNRYLNKSIEGGLKYFILGSLASGFFLFGISLIYGFTGLTTFTELKLFLQTLPLLNTTTILDLNYESNFTFYNFIFNQFNSYFLVSSFYWILFTGLFFIFVAFSFKFSIVPFHSWTPDVYEGSPLLITAFFALVPKIGIFYLFIKFLEIFMLFSVFKDIFQVLGLITILIGSLGALTQIKIKRLLAYSTISNMGFIFLGFSLNTFNGLHASLVYILIYIFLNICFFSILISLRKNTGKLVTNITELTSIYRSNPILAIMLAITLFSIAGIPPMAGFFNKLYLLYALIYKTKIFVAFIVVFTGVYSSIYYIRLIKIMFFEKPFIWSFYKKSSIIIIYLLINLTFINIFFLFWLDFILILTRNLCVNIFYL